MRSALAVCIALVGCGPPVLQNAPRPNPAIVAGAAAAIAGAATLADPAAAARAVEDNKPVPDTRPTQVNRTVPPDVFDRLDEQQQLKPAVARPAARIKDPEPAEPAEPAELEDDPIDARD